MAEKSQPRLNEKEMMVFETGIRPNTAGSPQNFIQNRNQQSTNVMISRNNKRKG